MTASWREELITAPDLYISIHVCLRESDCGTRARANAAHASAPPRPAPVRRKQRGGQKSDRFTGDIRALHKNQILRAGLLQSQLSGGADSELCSLKQSV